MIKLDSGYYFDDTKNLCFIGNYEDGR
jgi:hypothetical protein